MEQKLIIGGVVVLVAAAIGIFVFTPQQPADQTVASGTYAALAQCIKDSGAIFYGAWWCPHCSNQKKLFGSDADALPYVECSTPDGKGQLPACREADVTGYPTWVYPDGSRQTGEVPLATLAQKTGCTLPQAAPQTDIDAGAESPAN